MAFSNVLPLGSLVVIGSVDDPVVEVTIEVRKHAVPFQDGGPQPPAGSYNAWRYVVTHFRTAQNVVWDLYNQPQNSQIDPVMLQNLLNAANAPNNYLGPVINVCSWVTCELTMRNMLGLMPGEQWKMELPPIGANGDWMPMGGMLPTTGVATHLHGGNVTSNNDGWPLTPIRPNDTQTFIYPNEQRAAMLWFHDHGMDNTAPQVIAGLAGLYFIRDESDMRINNWLSNQGWAHSGEIPLVIQDRVFSADDKYVDYDAGMPGMMTPGLRLEYMGKHIFVNGRETPRHSVASGWYRLRLLNGSNARTYALALCELNPSSQVAPINWRSNLMTVIGTEAGLATQPQNLGQNDYLLLAPGERADVLVQLADPFQNRQVYLVNLAVRSYSDAGNVIDNEAIYQDEGLSVIRPGTLDGYIAQELAAAASPVQVMRFDVTHSLPLLPDNTRPALGSILRQHGQEDGFVYSRLCLTPWHCIPWPWRWPDLTSPTTPARNRMVLLMNNTGNLGGGTNGATGATGANSLSLNTAWRDTQIWELEPVPANGGKPTWKLPFAANLAVNNPAAGNPSSTLMEYAVARTTFFESSAYDMATGDTQQAGINNLRQSGAFPNLHAPTFSPKSGSYERWYVANIGNANLVNGVLDGTTDPGIPDMHPFHMHLVNFVVLRRWKLLQPGGPGTPYQYVQQNAGGVYWKSRHETIRIEANELVELLVHFPQRRSGNYVYHCHLVEHEDMGMMQHFNVTFRWWLPDPPRRRPPFFYDPGDPAPRIRLLDKVINVVRSVLGLSQNRSNKY